MKKIGLWTSAWDQVAIDLVEEIYRNFPDDVAYVFLSRGSNETNYGDLMIRRVQELGIPLCTFSSLRFKADLREKDRETWRREYDQVLINFLPPADIDVLVGYMWWFGKEMCEARTAINLHPALPSGPKGTYVEIIWRLIRERATETGIMIHLVTPERDRGPVITFCRFPIRGEGFDPLWQEEEGENDKLFDAIRKKGVIREFPMVVKTIKTIMEGKVRIEKGKISDASGQVLESGYDLTEEIDTAIEEEI